jgi:rhodanese-related sulfurtransferase
MKRYTDLINEVLPEITEVFPWDLEERLKENSDILIVDIREPYEFDAMHIEGSINIPRGILETACEWDYEETVPELVEARNREVVLACRSGNRSVLAAYVMQLMGYENVASLKTGLRGWNDYELPLVKKEDAAVDIDDADEYFESNVRSDQLAPERRSSP